MNHPDQREGLDGWIGRGGSCVWERAAEACGSVSADVSKPVRTCREVGGRKPSSHGYGDALEMGEVVAQTK